MGGLNGFLHTFFNLEVAARYLPGIARGFVLTAGLGVAVVVTGLLLGLALAVLRTSGRRGLSLAIVVFADIFRAIPPLVLLILIFFALPYVQISIPAYAATWLSLSLVLTAFAEESIWSGIVATPRGQTEAARASGLSASQTMAYVILPQALRSTLAPLTNRVLAITKNTALGSVIGLSDILGAAQTASSDSGSPTPLTVGALAYLLLFMPLVAFSRWIERHWTWKR